VARTGDDLLHTEACFCTTNYCNSGAPLVGAPKEMRCAEKVQGQFWGHTVKTMFKYLLHMILAHFHTQTRLPWRVLFQLGCEKRCWSAK
jgi:hypothetical protein